MAQVILSVTCNARISEKLGVGVAEAGRTEHPPQLGPRTDGNLGFKPPVLMEPAMRYRSG